MNVQTNTISPKKPIGEMLQGVVALGRRRYAVNLIWNQAEGRKPLVQEAKESSVRMGSTLFALRPGKGIWDDQFAIADVTLGHKPGLPSLAAALADELTNSLLGIWPLAENIWWLVGIREDGSIVYDRAVSDVNDIQQDFLEALSAGKWQQVLCPVEWNIPGADELIPLKGNISKGKVQLRPIKVNKTLFILAAVTTIAVLTGGAIGYQSYQEWVFQQQLANDAHRKRAGMVLPKKINVPEVPWAGKPLFSAVATQCMDDLVRYAEQSAQIPAWERGIGTCNGSEVSYSLKNNGGTESWLTIMADRLPTKPLSVSVEGDEATLGWSLPNAPVYPPNSPGVPVHKAQQYLTVQLAELFTPIHFSQGQQQTFWLSVKYSLKDVADLPALLPLFKSIPASVMHSMTYDPDKKLWSLEAEIYERRQLTGQQLETLKQARG